MDCTFPIINKLKIEDREIESLIPYVRNARVHSNKQVSQIAESIKEFGFNDPVAVDSDCGIIEGHGRILAAKELGIEVIPVIELSHLSNIQKRAYILAHNKLTENAGWDVEVLEIEMVSLVAAGAEGLTGFCKGDIEDLIQGSNFEPGTEDEQGKLDEFDAKLVICPYCGKECDLNEI